MIIQSKRVWILNTFIEAQIEINGTKIINIFDYGTKKVDVDYGDKRIVPGFIDMHTHGYAGFDTNDGKEEGLRYWLKNLPSEGVTSFCPTTITQSKDVLIRALKNVANVANSYYEGAEILGVHLEGPYLDKKYKGAQPEKYCVSPSVKEFREYQEACDDMIKVITMACEHDTNFELTKYCVDHNVLVSQGHSAATYKEATMAIANGAMSMTHVFNGMTGFHHREPGLVGAAMRFRNVFGEIICDCHHVNKEALNNYFTCKGKDFAIMISDAVLAKNCPVGTRLAFGGNDIEVKEDGCAYLLGTNTLAGSTLKINEGLRNLVEKAGVPFEYALNACTINPARALKVDDHKGKLVSGYDGDIVVLDDDYSVKKTYARGKIVF